MKMKMKRLFKILLYVAAVIAVLAVILQFDAVSAPVANALNVAQEKISYWSKTALWLSVGVILIIAGASSMAVPLIGISLIVVGAALLIMAVWPSIFSRKSVNE